jgi:TPR repeat protein
LKATEAPSLVLLRMHVRHSLRSRMDDLTPGQLFHLGRERLMEGEVSFSLDLLRRAAREGHEEARWITRLCDLRAAQKPARLPPGSQMADWRQCRDAKFEWLKLVFSQCGAVTEGAEGRALFYEGQFLSHDDPRRSALLLAAAEKGFPRALAELGSELLYSEQRRAAVLLERAAELGEPYAMYHLAGFVQARAQATRQPGPDFERESVESFRLYLRSAELGLVASFGHVAEVYREGTFGNEIARDERLHLYWSAREAAFSSCAFGPELTTVFSYPVARFNPDVCHGPWLGHLFCMGREFDRCASIGLRLESMELCDRLASFYNAVCHAARWAALTPYPFLKRRLGKDVAQMIGKMAYATRLEDGMLEEWREAARRM